MKSNEIVRDFMGLMKSYEVLWKFVKYIECFYSTCILDRFSNIDVEHVNFVEFCEM